MKSIHIISVGASIITNYNKFSNGIELPSIEDDSKFESILTNQEKFKNILDFVKKDRYKASAELNALRVFMENDSISEVHLIVTDTFVGNINYKIIKDILQEFKIICSHKIIPGYYKEKVKDEIEAEQKFIKGLLDLRNSLIQYIRNKKSADQDIEILLNATGGFKPEMMILMLVGSLTNCKVYYIHEFFKRILYLPPLFLPFINNKISDAISELNNLTQKRMSGEALCAEYKEKYKDVYIELLKLKLITEKYGEKDDKLFEISITDYGKLLSDLKNNN